MSAEKRIFNRMIINIIETKFDLTKVTETMLLIEPTDDMHEIEHWEDRLDEVNMPYALVECRRTNRGKNVFLGYSLVTKTNLLLPSNV